MEDDSWHGGISDLMTGLMMIFLLIAISYMLMVEKKGSVVKEIVVTRTIYEDCPVEKKESVVKEIVATYNELQVGLYESLFDEF